MNPSNIHTRANARACESADDDHDREDDQTAIDLFGENGSGEQEPEKRPRKKSDTKQLEREFEHFWSIYPKRTAKADARRAFVAALKSGVHLQTILAGAKRYAEKIQSAGTESRYIKNASGWICGARWEDQHEPEDELRNATTATAGAIAGVFNALSGGKWRQ